MSTSTVDKSSNMAAVQNGKLFSCGNHSVETVKGMLHFGDPSEIICILAVPTTMTVRDVIQFLNPSMQDIENTRIVREVNSDSSYMVLLKFRNEDSAKEYYQNYDGVQFNSLEENVCKLLYVSRVETFTEDTADIKENSNCAVCLDRMYTDVESIITILCNHSFHSHCLSKWSDTSCPVCRYCQTPENQIENRCLDCSYEGDSLWMCIICGYVACGRYINGHAYDHFSQTQHTYAMQLTDNQVWDYAGDNYVHRLLANKADGKPVEIEGEEAFRQAEKIEAVQLEYNYLLEQQLESQRKYYDKLKREYEKQCKKELEDAKARYEQVADRLAQLQLDHDQLNKERSALDKKMHTIQGKLTKSTTALAEEREITKCLTLNQEQFQTKLRQLEESSAEKDNRIKELEEQLRDLMFFLEARDKIDNSVNENVISRDEITDGQIIVQEAPSTSASVRKNNRRKKK